MINSMIYIESQAICIVLLLVLWSYNARFEHYMKKSLKGIYILAFLASAADILRCSLNGTGFDLLLHTANILYFGALSFIGYLWLCYSARKLYKKLYKKKSFKILSLIPAVIVTVITVLSSVTGTLYRIGADGVLNRGAGYLTVLINYIYPVAVWVMVLTALSKNISNRQKKEKLSLALLTLPPMGFGLLQIILPQGISLITYSVLISLLILFINSQYRRIRVDNLTRLLNRYGMDDEIYVQLEQYKKDKNDLFYVIACDLDNFKHINDTWGHKEGDRALKLISEVLIRVAEKYDSQAFRIGGDEFVIFVDVSEDTIPNMICEELKTELDNIDFRDDFDIKMSMGMAKYDGTVPVEELLNQADMQLYEVKRKSKQEN